MTRFQQEPQSTPLAAPPVVHQPGSKRLIGLLLVGSLALSLAACKQQYSQKNFNPASGKLVAMVNNEAILLKQFEQAFAKTSQRWERFLQQDKKKQSELQQLVLNKLIEEKLLLQEARRLGLHVSDAELDEALQRLLGDENRPQQLPFTLGGIQNSWKEDLRQRLLQEKLVRKVVIEKISISERELRLYYQRNLHEFRQPEKRRALHIGVGTQRMFYQVTQQLRNGADFSRLARKYSITPDRSRGGDLGLVRRGVLPTEFDEEIFSLNKIGQVNTGWQPVRTKMGFHLFRLVEHRPARLLTYAEARPQIRAKLMRNKQPQIYQAWIQKLRKKNHIQINESALRRHRP